MLTNLRAIVLSYEKLLRQTLCVALFLGGGSLTLAQDAANLKDLPDAPVVQKVEPPNWWVGLTSDVMVLLSGKNLNAIRASCNIPEVLVDRTQSSAGGDYLFVWLKFGPKLKSGTLVCRINTTRGETSFELPLAARAPILGRNQGLSLNDVLYRLIPDRFANGDPTNDEPKEESGSHDRTNPRAWHGGDLRGVSEHLGYLNDLGITSMELTPVTREGSTVVYPGFGAVDLYSVDPHLGTLADLKDLVAAAHKRHMKVFFDAFPNFVSPTHPWVANPPTPDWFHETRQETKSVPPLKRNFYGQPAGKDGKSGDFLEALEDPHTAPASHNNFKDGGIFGDLPGLNTENPVVAEYLLQNAIWWAESSGLDGYRIKAFPFTRRKFWADWHAGLRQIYPRLSTIGEVFHPDPTVTSFFAGGAQYFWDAKCKGHV